MWASIAEIDPGRFDRFVEVEEMLAEEKQVEIKRVERAYNAIAHAEGKSATDARGAIENAYASGVSDEFIVPTVLDGYDGLKDGDGLLFLNFRADRARGGIPPCRSERWCRPAGRR